MHSKLLIWILCTLAGVLPFVHSEGERSSLQNHQPDEWPTYLYEERLIPTELSEQDQRFANDFPGAIMKFSTSAGKIVVRWTDKASRKLHPAADCFRGSGYVVHYKPIRVDTDRHHWGCFAAARGTESVQVCERIYDQFGNEFTDASSWYWNAVFGKSTGPWWAVTLVEEES